MAKKAKSKAKAAPKKAKPHNWRELERGAAADKDLEDLNKRLAKRGSYKGSPH